MGLSATVPTDSARGRSGVTAEKHLAEPISEEEDLS
jgi:hypothetical protein